METETAAKTSTILMCVMVEASVLVVVMSLSGRHVLAGEGEGGRWRDGTGLTTWTRGDDTCDERAQSGGDELLELHLDSGGSE